MPANLSVNLNAIAELRNRRNLPWPNVVEFGQIALETGAHGVTVHPRPDQRHIRFTDVPELRAMVDDLYPDREYNIEGYPTQEFIDMVLEVHPEQVTLVPDDPAQATSDHGWDFASNVAFLTPIVSRFKDAGIRVSLFADPEPEAVGFAAQTGADRIELYTGPYGAAFDNNELAARACEQLALTAQAALAHGLDVNAGHDLTVANLPELARAIPDLAEVSIGHGLTADALRFGMEATVKRFLHACGWPASQSPGSSL